MSEAAQGEATPGREVRERKLTGNCTLTGDEDSSGMSSVTDFAVFCVSH